MMGKAREARINDGYKARRRRNLADPYFYMETIATIIPANLVPNSLLSFFVLS